MAAELLKNLLNLQLKMQQSGEINESKMTRQRTLLNMLSAEIQGGKEVDVSALSDVCIKYVSILVTLDNVDELRANLRIIEEFFKIKKISRRLFQELGKQIIETILDPSMELWLCNELVQLLNSILELIGKLKRDEFPYIRLYSMKLMDVLTLCGDYDVQFAILELIFRLIPDTKNESVAKGMFPVEASLQDLFRQIENDEFEKCARTFLNAVNETYDSVLSIDAENVFAGPNKIHPMKGQKLWIDFNSKSETVSIVCAHLNKINCKKGYVICIEKPYIGNILFRTDLKNKKACKLEFKVINPEKIFGKILKDADDCTVISIVFLKCSKVTRLRSDYLPNHYAKLFNREEWSQTSTTDITNFHIPNVLTAKNTKSCSSNITSNVSFKSLEPDLMGQKIISERTKKPFNEIYNIGNHILLVSHHIKSKNSNILISNKNTCESSSSNSMDLKNCNSNVLVNNRNFNNKNLEVNDMKNVILTTTIRKKPPLRASKKQRTRDRNCVSTLMTIPEQDEEKKTSLYFRSSKGQNVNKCDETSTPELEPEQQKTQHKLFSNSATYLTAKKSQGKLVDHEDTVDISTSKEQKDQIISNKSIHMPVEQSQETEKDPLISNKSIHMQRDQSQETERNLPISNESIHKTVEQSQETENIASALQEEKLTTESIPLENQEEIHVSEEVSRVSIRDEVTNDDLSMQELPLISLVGKHPCPEGNSSIFSKVKNECNAILSGDTIRYSQQQLLNLTPSLRIKEDNILPLTANDNSVKITTNILNAGQNLVTENISNEKEENGQLKEAATALGEHLKGCSEHLLPEPKQCLVAGNISTSDAEIKVISKTKKDSGDCITEAEPKVIDIEMPQVTKSANLGVSCAVSIAENITDNNSSKSSMQVSSLNKTTQSNERSFALDSQNIHDNSSFSEQNVKENDRTNLLFGASNEVKCNKEIASDQTGKGDDSICERDGSPSIQATSVNKEINHRHSSDNIEKSEEMQVSESDVTMEELNFNISNVIPMVHLQRCKNIEMILEKQNEETEENEVANTNSGNQDLEASCLYTTNNEDKQPDLNNSNQLHVENTQCLNQSNSEISSSNKMDTGIGSNCDDYDEPQQNLETPGTLLNEEISEQKKENEVCNAAKIVTDILPLETLNSSAEIADCDIECTRITIQADVHQFPNESAKEVNVTEDVSSQHYLPKDKCLSEDVRSEVYSEASKLSSMYAEKYLNLLKEKAKLSPVRERSVYNDPYLAEVYNERRKTPRRRTRKLFNEGDLSYLTDNCRDETRNVENCTDQTKKQMNTEELLGILDSQRCKDIETCSKNIKQVSPVQNKHTTSSDNEATVKDNTVSDLIKYTKTDKSEIEVPNVESVLSHQDTIEKNKELPKKRKLKKNETDKNVTNPPKKLKTNKVFEIMGNLTNVVNGILDENQEEEIPTKKSKNKRQKENAHGMLDYLIESTSNITGQKSDTLKSHRESRANKGRYFAEMFDCVVDNYTDLKFINRNVIRKKRKINIPRGKYRFNEKHEQPPGKVNILQDIRIIPDTTTLGSSNELLDYIVSDLTGLINKIYKFKGSILGSTTI